MVINDETRNARHRDFIQCDQLLFESGPTWVRFSGGAGTRLASTPMEGFRCNTQGTGWYNGSYPTVVGATTTGTVCFGWPNNDCQWSNEISVMNCGKFYVFELDAPPACYLRYCTV
jgi:hypothetical protein